MVSERLSSTPSSSVSPGDPNAPSPGSSSGSGWPATAQERARLSEWKRRQTALTSSLPCPGRSSSAALVMVRISAGSLLLAAKAAIWARTKVARRAAFGPWPTTSPTTAMVEPSGLLVSR